jgi:hypothetical protein
VEEAAGAWLDARSKREAVELGMRTLERLRRQDELEAPTSNRPTTECWRLLGLD